MVTLHFRDGREAKQYNSTDAAMNAAEDMLFVYPSIDYTIATSDKAQFEDLDRIVDIDGQLLLPLCTVGHAEGLEVVWIEAGKETN